MKINNATPVIRNNVQANKNKKNVEFKGCFEGFKPTELLKLSRQGTMLRNLFTINAFVFLLGSRIFTSRDEDERREILVRDIPTIVIAVMGVPFVEKLVAKLIQDKTGFAIMENAGEQGNITKKINEIFNKPNRNKIETANYSRLEDWYIYDKNLSSGFKGFSERIKKLGGDLKKIYSSVGSNIKEQLKGLSDNNDEFIKQLTQNKNLMETLETEMAKVGNNALKQALFLKTIAKLAGFGVTLATIGIFIPNLNIFITETIHKNKKETVQKAEAQKSADIERAA